MAGLDGWDEQYPGINDDVNTVDDRGDSLLHIAARRLNAGMIEHLVLHGL